MSGRGAWDGEDYQRRIDEQTAGRDDPHGEADLVEGLAPASVLDAGCGTGRVAIELARRGVDVLGVDLDASMLATARRRAPDLPWVRADLATLALGRTFDVVVMAGNVPLFTAPGTTAAVVERCARHVIPGGHLVTGFSMRDDYGADEYSAEARAAGLEAVVRYATWDGDRFDPAGDYVVAVDRRPAAARTGPAS